MSTAYLLARSFDSSLSFSGALTHTVTENKNTAPLVWSTQTGTLVPNPNSDVQTGYDAVQVYPEYNWRVLNVYITDGSNTVGEIITYRSKTQVRYESTAKQLASDAELFEFFGYDPIAIELYTALGKNPPTVVVA